MDSAAREALAARVLEGSPADETEVILFDSDARFARFTHNAIHQNLAAADVVVRVRAIIDRRTGVASTNDLSRASLDRTVARASELARLSPRDEHLAPLVEAPRARAARDAYSPTTADASADLRAGIARRIFDVAERDGLWAAGFVTTGSAAVTLANSRGTVQSFDGTDCGISVKQNARDSSGYAECFATDVARLDGDLTATVAARKATRSAAPLPVEPGEWTVILEPPAFGELVAFIASHFSAQSYDEGSSFFSGRLGETFAGDNVTIVDDVAHPLNPAMPFDFEGTPTQRVPLFDRGVASNVVTDAAWSAKLGRENTGHALPAPNAEGPLPSHVVVQPGTKPLEQLIAETHRGLLVSRLWYVRTVDQRQTTLTGMTRDGTFLIEGGEVGRGVRNMRFNHSLLEALRNAEFARDLVRTGSYHYSMVVPAVKIAGFHFSSTTEF
jgi:PmbA protein